jgi:hypothetical protein
MNKYSNILGKKNKTKPVDLGLLALNQKDFRSLLLHICAIHVLDMSFDQFICLYLFICFLLSCCWSLCFRLNFCLNCGSRSTPSYVPIFTPQNIDEQMDTVILINDIILYYRML